jgi:RNA polymerase sigma factor (sigma-70 family)
LLDSKQAYQEPELVQALKQHDNHAYAYLYKNYSGSLYTIISQIIPERETANDVLQELFVTVWKNIDKYDPSKGKLFTWLLRLAHNTAINKTRSKIFKSQQKNEDLGFFVDTIEGSAPQHQQINQIGLRKVVHQLRDDYKNVVELSYFQGFTHEEISKELNIPLGTVKTRLRNALIELRKRFV